MKNEFFSTIFVYFHFTRIFQENKMKNGLWAWASEKITLRKWSHIRFDWVRLPVWKKHWQSRMWKIVWNSFVHIFIRLFGCMVIIHHILSIWNHTGAKIIPSELKMPKRGTLLTDFEMGKITGLHEDGKSVTEIADALGRSYNCIGNFLNEKDRIQLGSRTRPKTMPNITKFSNKLVLLLDS